MEITSLHANRINDKLLRSSRIVTDVQQSKRHTSGNWKHRIHHDALSHCGLHDRGSTMALTIQEKPSRNWVITL